jgi:tRNA(Ile)-lysidine synthase TilS/MesJ
MSPTAYVAMGHNKDDRLENIFQNIATQTKYDNLSGMDLVVEQDGIRFFRPFLNVTKDDIIRYARSHNIPYLPNSTPLHFMRGQIRNTIVPTMNNWNAEFVPGLFHLQNVLSEMSSIVDSTVTAFVEKFDDQKRAVVDESYTRMGTYFWKSVFEKMFPDRTFKTRMMGEFSNALDRFEESTTFQLNKNTRITMTRRKESIVIRFHDT